MWEHLFGLRINSNPTPLPRDSRYRFDKGYDNLLSLNVSPILIRLTVSSDAFTICPISLLDIEVVNNSLNVVAVDGFRMAWFKQDLENATSDFKAVIPGKTLNEVNKILLDSFETIKIGVAKNQALFEMDNCKIVTRILDGEFLNYKNVIPENWETRIKVNKNNLQNSFERISLISASSVEKEKKYPVKINVDIGKVVISCTNQTGDAKEELFVSTEGKNLEAGFNPKYFLDSLKAIDDENVFVEFGTSISPCLIKSTENKDYVYMILPIRLKED